MSTDDEVQQLLGRVLDDAPAAPSPERLGAFRTQVEAARRRRTDDRPADPEERPRPRWISLTAAAAVLVAAMAVGFVAGRAGDDDGGTVAGDVEYDGPLVGPGGESTDAIASVVRTGIGRVIQFDTAELPILPTGEFYEVWFVGPGDSAASPNRISAGTFHPDPDGRSSVRFAAAVDPVDYPAISITAEPGDGNPAATGPEVLRADLS